MWSPPGRENPASFPLELGALGLSSVPPPPVEGTEGAGRRVEGVGEACGALGVPRGNRGSPQGVQLIRSVSLSCPPRVLRTAIPAFSRPADATHKSVLLTGQERSQPLRRSPARLGKPNSSYYYYRSSWNFSAGDLGSQEASLVRA